MAVSARTARAVSADLVIDHIIKLTMSEYRAKGLYKERPKIQLNAQLMSFKNGGHSSHHIYSDFRSGDVSSSTHADVTYLTAQLRYEQKA